MKLRGMILALSIALTVLLLPQAAYATTAYYLTAPNAGLGGLSSSYQTPFGTVTVTLNSSTTATIGFSASSDYCIVGNNKGSGNKGAFGVNINASSFTYANLTYGPSAGANSVNWLGTSQM
ncbi:MAG: hypothetical protein NTW80_12745, partial [Deltaproteobacteria bacterium]|nr:hypothetical protein [Deltaproteobacteria bacterium]